MIQVILAQTCASPVLNIRLTSLLKNGQNQHYEPSPKIHSTLAAHVKQYQNVDAS